MSVNTLLPVQGNNLSDSLSTSVGSTDLTLPVNSVSIWSSAGGKVVIDRGLSTQEIIATTGKSGSSLTVPSGGRGLEGTTAVGHNSGATVESVPFAGDYNAVVTALTNVVQASDGTLDTTKVVNLTTAQTLTNKRITKRVLSLSAGSATPTINTDSYDVVHITAQSAAITSFTTNLTGTPVGGDTLRIDITDDGTARAITWGASFESSAILLPTTTVISQRLDIDFIWNTVTSKWRCKGATTSAAYGSLGFTNVTSNQTGISTLADITNLQSVVTVPAGRSIKITAWAQFIPSVVNAQVGFSIVEGSTQLTEAVIYLPALSQFSAFAQVVLSAPSTGSHTYKCQARLAGGTGTITVNSTATTPSVILVELL